MKKFFCFLVLLLTPLLAFAHGMLEADKVKMLQAGGQDFIWFGATHMLTGYDHLLFLFGVIFFLTKFSDIVKFVTAFTIGHSITLILATFLKIQANYYLIDAVIALTVMYKGFDNIDGFRKYFKVEPPNVLKAVFLFGLIHGFGLSTRLQKIALGDGTKLLNKIIGFNIGVELGQIAALIVFVLLLAIWRKKESFKKFSFAANSLLIFVGFLLLLMQLHLYTHTQYPDEFGFNKDSHIHHHEDLDEQIK
jgi:hypothetical protein